MFYMELLCETWERKAHVASSCHPRGQARNLSAVGARRLQRSTGATEPRTAGIHKGINGKGEERQRGGGDETPVKCGWLPSNQVLITYHGGTAKAVTSGIGHESLNSAPS